MKYPSFIEDQVCEQLAEVLTQALRTACMAIPNRTGHTLPEDSNFIQNLTVMVDDVDARLVTVLIPEYVKFLDSGLPTGIRVPIPTLLDWMQRRHIFGDNNLVYAIQESIYQNGIPARPFSDTIQRVTEDTIKQWKPELIKALVSSIKKQLLSWFSR